jgi:hypothetical protein
MQGIGMERWPMLETTRQMVVHQVQVEAIRRREKAVRVHIVMMLPATDCFC